MTQLTKETDPTYGMGWWSVQFSFNDIGLNSLYLVMFFPVTIGMIVEAISVLKLKYCEFFSFFARRTKTLFLGKK